MLSRRATVIGRERLENDFTVYFEGRSVGRIRLADNHVANTEEWVWNITVPLPVPTWANGAASSIEGAATEFKSAWERFCARLSPSAIEHWHQVADARAALFRD